jgi:tripartite-type tricarboxylate transporter receptor subunit TctC
MHRATATRRSTLLLALATTFAAATPALAQSDYPSKPITLIVPYPAGGANDAVARLVGQKMAEGLKQPVIIDNKPGAGTTIGTALVAKAPADGYTLVLGSLASHAVAPHLYGKPGYHAIDDFAPLGTIGLAPIVLVVAKDAPYADLKAVVDAAKAKPDMLTYGSSGNGSPLHLAGELFKQAAHIKVTHVPYKGGNAHTMDLMGGRLDIILDTATSAVPMIKGDKVRPLAVAASQRMAEFPNVPTFAEAGYPGFEVSAWYALYAPAKTPKPVLDRLNAELNAALKASEVSDKLKNLGVRPVSGSAAELAAFTKAEYDRYEKVMREGNIRID